MNRIVLLYASIVFTIFLSYSCKSVERIFSGEPKLDMDEKDLINNVLSNDLSFDNIFFKRVQYNFEFEDQERSLKGNLFIQRDSFIVISVTPIMGIELFRIVLEPNQVSIIDRINKKVILTDYNYLKSKYLFDLNYFSFQDILTNSFFTYPYNLPFVDTRFKGSIENNVYSLKSKSNTNQRSGVNIKAQQIINILPELYRVSNTTILIPEDQTIFKVNYTNFRSFDGNFIFPENIEMEGSHMTDRIRLLFNFSQIEINSSQSISSTIPDNYERVNM